VGVAVRRYDSDRFLTALFAPSHKRDTLLTLYAFNHQLARAREAASQPTLALMRLQFWREVVEGEPRAHDVAAPLGAALSRGELDRDDLLALIDARETEAEPSIPTLNSWIAYLLASAGGLMVTAGRLLGAPEPERLRRPGAAYGAAGGLRSVPALARQGRCMLPVDTLEAHGLTPEMVIAHPNRPEVQAALRVLSAEGRALLRGASALRLPRSAIAAALPTVLARRDLTPRRVGQRLTAGRGIGDRLAVLRAALTGRIA
jgi:phytoene synthase